MAANKVCCIIITQSHLTACIAADVQSHWRCIISSFNFCHTHSYFSESICLHPIQNFQYPRPPPHPLSAIESQLHPGPGMIDSLAFFLLLSALPPSSALPALPLSTSTASRSLTSSPRSLSYPPLVRGPHCFPLYSLFRFCFCSGLNRSVVYNSVGNVGLLLFRFSVGGGIGILRLL
jgi:hypothetical protein